MSQGAKWQHRMNPTDAVFWTMDRIPELRSTTGALLVLAKAANRETLRADLERMTRHLPRMRQRVVDVPLGLAPPEWVEDTQFDLDYHLRTIGVPAPGGMAELLDTVGPLYATPFDRDRPLWEAYAAEGLTGGRGAVFLKVHHCLTDGVGASRLLETLMGEPARSERSAREHARDAVDTTPGALLWRAARYNLGETLSLGASAAGAFAASALAPREAFDGLAHGMRAAAGFARELAVPRAQSPIHAQRSLSRRLSNFDMSLVDVRAAGERVEATVNDVVLTMVCGALHRWHTSRGADVKELRATVPVNLRHDEDDEAGNRLALLAIRLPVGEPNPLRRLRLIQERMARVKSDRRARLYPLLARVMLRLPLPVAAEIGRQQMARTNFVCTNIPGPRTTCYLAGEEIERIYPYAPMVGDHPVAIALFSYRDAIGVGLDVDPLAMGDLAHFRDALGESYEEVLAVAREDVAPSLRHRRRTSRAASGGRSASPSPRRRSPA